MKRLVFTVSVTVMIICFNLVVYSHDDHTAIKDFDEGVIVTEVDCTLTDGTDSTCFQIEGVAIPVFEIGPFCPETLDDVGGVWDWDGEDAGVYSLDREFFEMVAEQGYVFYDDDGNISIITQVGGGAPGGGGGNTGGSSCLAQTADEEVTMTALIPAEPVIANAPTDLGTVAQVGVAIDGVPIFADAPSVLDTGNLPALDTCGGHVDPGGWYHWHATASDIDSSLDHEGVEDVHCHLEQSASALFAYAFDGFPIYGSAEPDGSLPEDLDDCGGHVGPTPESEEDTYHYHAGLDFPNLPTCLVGVVASNNFTTTATAGIGATGGPSGGNGPGGQGQNRPDFAAAAEELGVTQQELQDALGQPPNFEAAAEVLDITVEELQEALATTTSTDDMQEDTDQEPETQNATSDSGNRLTDGPPIPGEYGPLSASDLNRDGTVTRAEIEVFMEVGPYRRIGLVAFFDLSDTNGDGSLDADEFAAVEPPYAFDGTDADANGIVTRTEVETYVANRLYRQIGLEAFFDLVDTDQNDELSPEEIQAALDTGVLTLD